MRILALTALALAVPAAALPASRIAPNPCWLLTAKTASASLGTTANPYLQTSRSGARICLYIAGAKRLTLEIGKRSEYARASAATSPKGTVIKSFAWGENGALVYAPSGPHTHISLAAFELGSYYYSVYSEQLSPTRIRGLSYLVYEKLPH